MKCSTLLTTLAISSVSLLPTVGAWEVSWHDSDDKSHSRTGHGPSDCIEIDNPEGKVFKIDSKGEKGINMLLFDNDECAGKSAGSATEDFSKKASLPLLGFKVVSLSASNSSSETTSADKSTTTSSHAATTSTDTSAASTKHASSTSSSQSGKSTTTSESISVTATITESGTTSQASPTTSSAASATTSNAAVRLASSGDNTAKGVFGGLLGLAVAQWVL